MGQIIVTALIAGAVSGFASGVFAQDGDLFTSIQNVINGIVQSLTGII